MVKVQIKKLDPKVQIPKYKTDGSSGVDLMAFLNETKIVMPGESILVPTGLSLAVPEDLEVQIRLTIRKTRVEFTFIRKKIEKKVIFKVKRTKEPLQKIQKIKKRLLSRRLRVLNTSTMYSMLIFQLLLV